ncbi:hypothetical protein D3C73_1205050 [compost metagenome]
MTAEHFAEAAQFLDHDRRGGQRQAGTEHECRGRRQPGQHQQRAGNGPGQQDLQASQAKHDAAQLDHFREGKLQAQGEQQEHHPQLRDQRQYRAVVDPVEGRGAYDQANAKVAQYRRQVQPVEKGNDHQRGRKKNQKAD